MTTILFIGLGHMGSGMAANLARAGHSVLAHDLSEAALAAAVKEGCEAAGDLASAAARADVVVSMLPAGSHVREVYLGEGGLADSAREGSLFIDCSTIDGDSAIAVGQAARDRGFYFVDAPVSGGVAAAQAGTLTFMVGGAAEAFEKARPVLEGMGSNIFHAGDIGAGQAAKICNNMLLAISMIGTCEAFNLAQKLGLDPQVFFDISSKASGQCWSMTSYCPVPGPVPAAPSNRDYQPGFAAAMMLKDLRLAHNAAEKARAATPLGSHAQSLYTMMEAAGADDLDFSGVMKLIRGDLKDA